MPLADLRTRARKDPLGVTLYNQLLSNTAWLSSDLASEHRVADGLHNAPEIPMVCGTVVWDGSDYSIEGGENGTATIELDGAQADYNPAVGTVKILTTGLTFGATSPTLKDQIAVEVASSSETGLTAPVVAGYEIGTGTDTGYIFVYLQTGDTGTGAWTPEDGNFDIRIYSTPTLAGAPLDAGTPALRGQGLFASKWNKLVTTMAQLYTRYSNFHDVSTGAHNVLTIPKTEGVIICQGTTYSVDSGSNIASVTRLAKGHIQVNLTTTLVDYLQVFPEAYNLAFYAGQATLICCPRSTHAAASGTIEFFIYKFDYYGTPIIGLGPYSWALVDSSFAFSAHGDE